MAILGAGHGVLLIRVSQQVDLAAPVNHDARRGDRQPLGPLADERAGTLEERVVQPDIPRVVVAKGIDRDGGQSVLAGLEAQVGAVQVEPERQVGPERRPAGQDQDQLVERGDPRRELGCLRSIRPRSTTEPIRWTRGRNPSGSSTSPTP